MFEIVEKRTRRGVAATKFITVAVSRSKSKPAKQIEVGLPEFVANPAGLTGYVLVEYDKASRAFRLTKTTDESGYKASGKEGRGGDRYFIRFTPPVGMMDSVFPGGENRIHVWEYSTGHNSITFHLPR